MRFGEIPLEEAEGAILAHSLSVGGRRLKKGRRLSGADIVALRAGGETRVTAARLDPNDVGEDEAAARILRALAPDPQAVGLTAAAAFTGRANLYARETGVLALDAERIAALNALDEGVTVATLADRSRVAPRQMVATVKIIPYAVEGRTVARAEDLLSGGAIGLRGIVRRTASLILTRVGGQAEKLLDKGAAAVRQRLTALGIDCVEERRVAHAIGSIAEAVAGAEGEMVLILTGSATSDRADHGPAALIAAGGRLTRFGMPVDPGNLLFLGETAGADPRPVIGLPGCARSPQLNGADWVLERIACGIEVGAEDIAAMGVGGLLKEIASRPAPRAAAAAAPHRPVVSALLLAAGRSSRMGGRDKLAEPLPDGTALLSRVARELAASGVDETLAVLPALDHPRAALLPSGVTVVENPRSAEGMGRSIAAGMARIRSDADAVLLVLADMPEIGREGIDRLLAAFDPDEGREIVRATAEDGRPGHPVLFGRRFFEPLGLLDGDRGARDVLAQHGEFITEVALPGAAALTDLDSPEDWALWRARQGIDAAE
ncbi:MAG: NTP transferase domain-containing protein [Paracoccaceae bacterium]